MSLNCFHHFGSFIAKLLGFSFFMQLLECMLLKCICDMYMCVRKMSLFCSSYTGCDDRSRHAEAREAQRALGNGTRFPWLPGHGHLFFPSSPCEPSSHGIQIPVSTLGPRSSSAYFAGVVGRSSRHFARAAGSPSSDGCRMRFCLGIPPLQFSGDGVVVL